MKVWKCIMLVCVVLLLVACTGKTVRAIGPPLAESTQESTEMAVSETIESPTDSLPTDERSADASTTETVVIEATSEPIEIPPTEAVSNVTAAMLASTEGEAVVVIESENAYTDAEKAMLLKEIDLLLDETLKDLNSGDALDAWDENTGGGQ